MNHQPLPSHAGIAVTSNAPILLLEISRGRTAQSLRPVLSDRFLIGSDEACDLQLAAPEVPPLHSLLRSENGQPLFETLVPAPLPLVNDCRTASTILHDGDVIEIGPFCLTAHITGLAAADPPRSPSAGDDPSDCVSVDALSAGELVDLIEAEQARVDRFESRGQLGAAALLSAIRVRGTELASSGAAQCEESHRTGEGRLHALAALERLVESLNRLSEEAEACGRRLTVHEARQAEFAIRLSETRDVLKRNGKPDVVQPAPDQNTPVRRAA